ncbi:MAG: LacI family DNA-binding transcriptional regulator [Verrucomicrobia bacterium]|nr:LacI family DNA-binding transcriptional regulator [Verrucomicrobiota bacterium]
MERQITISHLARRLDVHPSTISLALRDSREVSAATRRRVCALARRLRYSPNQIARCLRQRSSRTLGVVFPYATLPYYATLLDAIYAEAHGRGLHLDVRFHQWDPREEEVAIRSLIEHRVAGLILLPAARCSCATLHRNLSASVSFPVALVGLSPFKNLPRAVQGFVGTDMRWGSQRLGEHLLEMGHRRIAFLTPERPLRSSSIGMRLAGLYSALREQPDATLQVVHLDEDERPDGGVAQVEQRGFPAQNSFLVGQRLAARFLELSPRPTAAITPDETMAHVLLASLSAAGLRVPDDVSLACYDGTHLSEFGGVPLTCVKQPIEKMARNLVDLAACPPPGNGATPAPNGRGHRPQTCVLQPTLIQRASIKRLRPPPFRTIPVHNSRRDSTLNHSHL